MKLTTIELCAGAGGQALGIHNAGFDHLALIDNDHHACETLRANFPGAKVIKKDIRKLDGSRFRAVDLIAAGIPCPPFSVAGLQRGAADERDLFPTMLRLVKQARPKAVIIENVAGLMGSKFDSYRKNIARRFRSLGYWVDFRVVDASTFGVPQRRSRVVIVALRQNIAKHFAWPVEQPRTKITVGQVLRLMMRADGWLGTDAWARNANDLAPTIVGGSKKHGGPDLGPKGARNAWAKLGVEGKSLADAAPPINFKGMPRLTVPMVARLQGFPADWQFAGRKTHTYRQVGNAFPPPVAEAIAKQIAAALIAARRARLAEQTNRALVVKPGQKGMFY